MKAFRLGTDGKLTLDPNVAEPKPAQGEVLIRVHAVGVTPSEPLWYPTTHTKAGAPRIGAIPGHEFAGTIAAIGDGVKEFNLADPIYGMNDWFADGATAQFCITQPNVIAPMPSSLSSAEAASVPIGALTAWQGLHEKLKLQKGERILIHGGSGGVGGYAVQLAKRIGAFVITTASERNADFLKSLGADRVIDYHTERFEDQCGTVDAVFDTVGGDTLRRSWRVLRPGGRLVTITTDSEGTVDARTKAAFFIVEPKRDQLVEIGQLIDAGDLQVVVDATVPFDLSAEAYAGHIGGSIGRGKVVIAMSPGG